MLAASSTTLINFPNKNGSDGDVKIERVAPRNRKALTPLSFTNQIAISPKC